MTVVFSTEISTKCDNSMRMISIPGMWNHAMCHHETTINYNKEVDDDDEVIKGYLERLWDIILLH